MGYFAYVFCLYFLHFAYVLGGYFVKLPMFLE